MHVQQLCLMFLAIFILSCHEAEVEVKKTEKENIKYSILVSDSNQTPLTLIVQRMAIIKKSLEQKIPILLLNGLDSSSAEAQQIAMHHPEFCKNLLDKKTGTAYRNEIFNVYAARPQEIPAAYHYGEVYKIEMYNFALNLTTIAMVDIGSNKVLTVQHLPSSQPDIPIHLKELALQIAIHSPEVIAALGYQPGEEEALMSNTKTALNKTKCERSLHLCVAPTFLKGDKALWAIIDLTEHKLVGIRWTQTGNKDEVKYLSERKLKYDKITTCYCKQVNSLEIKNWKLHYIITTSDGLRISEVYYKNQLVINHAKVVDWHVSYSNTDGFGYSDAVGCPEFSQAAVVAVSEPRISQLMENGIDIGFVLEQNFSSEQWPAPCNYNYLQRFEFYHDGRFRPVCGSLGRGCGNNGTYRPVIRISFPGDQNTFSEWVNNSWNPWLRENWKLSNEISGTHIIAQRTKEGYQYKISSGEGRGYFIEPGIGQFDDGGRGDNAYVYVTKQHPDRDEGENDMVSIGPCCNTDYKQGPEKFIDSLPENISNAAFVFWYVPQLKNDDTKGREYCWAENYLDHGIYKTRVFPCLAGPMFIPLNNDR